MSDYHGLTLPTLSDRCKVRATLHYDYARQPELMYTLNWLGMPLEVVQISRNNLRVVYHRLVFNSGPGNMLWVVQTLAPAQHSCILFELRPAPIPANLDPLPIRRNYQTSHLCTRIQATVYSLLRAHTELGRIL